MIRLLLVALVLAAVNAIPAYGHFFGATQSIDTYQVVFAPYPSNPVAGNSTFLNFSVLQNNTNIYNIHSAVVIKDKQSGEIVDQIPYRLYEFSDITIPYTFAKNGNYVVRLETRITGDEKYEATPLVASFDLFVGQIPFDELMLLYITPSAVAIAGIVIYLHSKKKL
jgi:hypothetical protein